MLLSATEEINLNNKERVNLFKSTERSENSYIGLGVFLELNRVFFRRMSCNSLITTDVHSYILMLL